MSLSYSAYYKDGEFYHNDQFEIPQGFTTNVIEFKSSGVREFYVQFCMDKLRFTLSYVMDLDNISLNGEQVIAFSGNHEYSFAKIARMYHSQITPLVNATNLSEVIEILGPIYKRLATFLEPPLTQEYINGFSLPMPLKNANKYLN